MTGEQHAEIGLAAVVPAGVALATGALPALPLAPTWLADPRPVGGGLLVAALVIGGGLLGALMPIWTPAEHAGGGAYAGVAAGYGGHGSSGCPPR